MSRRKTIDDWQASLPENKKCIDCVSESKSTRLLIVCLDHPDQQYWQRSDHARKNEGCVKCSPFAQSKVKTLEDWQSCMPSHKKCLEFRKEKSKTELRLQCQIHPEQIYWAFCDAAQSRNTCPECNRKTKTVDEWQARLPINKKCLEKRRVRSNTDLQIQCLDHPEQIYWQSCNLSTAGYEGCVMCSPRAGAYNRTNDEWQSLLPVNKMLLDVARGRNTRLFMRCAYHKEFTFWQDSGDAKIKEGCPKCNKGGGFKADKPATFYVLGVNLDINGDITPVVKIGITGRSVIDRYKCERAFESGWIVVAEKSFDVGRDALALESKIKRDSRSNLLLDAHGASEQMFKNTKFNEIYVDLPSHREWIEVTRNEAGLFKGLSA